jgi:mannose-6-phosphate isomerase-like protein (cupin superfamily)
MKITKPWGYEIILSPPDAKITSKILHINKNHRFSLQYHDKKEEILTLIKGKAIIYLGDKKENVKEYKMEKMKGYYIKPFQIHRVKGLTDCEILESSTPEVGNTVRLEDDYSRGTETEKARKLRGQKGVYMG